MRSLLFFISLGSVSVLLKPRPLDMPVYLNKVGFIDLLQHGRMRPVGGVQEEDIERMWASVK